MYGANLVGKLARKAANFSTTHASVVFGTATGNTTPGRPFLGLTEKEERAISRMLGAEREKLRKKIARIRERYTRDKNVVAFFVF